MLIITLDDEELLLEALTNAVRQAAPKAEVRPFSNAFDALDALRREGLHPDVVFTDIEMPGITGLELAKRLKDDTPAANIVFVTGFAQYALEAFSTRSSGYVMKPVTPEKISVELENLRVPVAAARTHAIRAQCFGSFEVFSDGIPLHFRYAKTKELFAFLVDRQGASQNTAELCAVLWENTPDSPKLHSQFRNLISDMTRTLGENGGANVLCKNFNQYSVNVDAFDCDLYRFLRREPSAVNAYAGEYMSQYSWAELRLKSAPD